MAKPYTDADVDQLHNAFAKAWTAHDRVHPVLEQCDTAELSEDCCDRQGLLAVLDALAAAGRLTPGAHRLDQESATDIVERHLVAAADYHGPAAIRRDVARGIVDALTAPHPVPADARPAPAHVVTFTNGTWTLSHPDDCTVTTPTGPALICNVHDLAVEQLPAGWLTGGRYEVAANDLGDRLQILDRLHDDQCTAPVCAACGCWCHTPTEPKDA